MANLLIIGAGGHGEVIGDIAENLNRWEKICYLDDNLALKQCLGHEIIGKVDDICKFIDEFDDVVIAIGNNDRRMYIHQKLNQMNIKTLSLIHPKAIVSKHSIIGKGSVVMAHAVINPNSIIGECCIVNTSSVIEHDCKIGNYVHISPKACVAGTVEIGDKSWIGANATVKNNVNIGINSIVGAGSVILKNVGDSMMFAGNPGRLIKSLKEER